MKIRCERQTALLDIGPMAGENGGEVLAVGTAEELMANPDSITGAYASGENPNCSRSSEKAAGLSDSKGASENNLKNISKVSNRRIYLCNRSFRFRKNPWY